MTTKHTVSKHSSGIDGWYVYRGIRFVRDDRNKGYWGHYSATVGSIMQETRQKITTATRKDLLEQIDAFIDEIKI